MIVLVIDVHVIIFCICIYINCSNCSRLSFCHGCCDVRSRYTALMCYISRPLSDGSISLFDGRRIALSLPKVSDMMADLARVAAPDGNSYNFLSETQVTALGNLRMQDDLFVAVSQSVMVDFCSCVILVIY